MITKEQVMADPDLLERLIREHQMFREAIEESPALFCVYDAQDRLVAWNRSYEQSHPEVFAARNAEARAGTLTYSDVVRYHLRSRYTGAELEAAVAERVELQRNASGEPVERHYHALGHLRVIKYALPSGAVAGFAVDIDDMVQARQDSEEKSAELEQAYAAMRHQALHDPLTGLPNRRYMDEHLRSLAEGEGGGALGVAMLHLDLDRFKVINDTLGHAAGDHILCHVADVLRASMGPADFAARIGGDEFTVIRTGGTDLPGLRQFADDLISGVTRPQSFDGQSCRVGMSIGIARMAKGAVSTQELMINADLALYRAKETGRGRVCDYNPEAEARSGLLAQVRDVQMG